MTMTPHRLLRATGAALGLNLLLVAAAFAQAAPPPPLAPLAVAARNGTKVFTTEHRGTFNGRDVSYRATVADTLIDLPAGQQAATLYTISYVATNQGPSATRPVVFVFNGGPGASSSILHFVGMGPKRLSTVSADALGDTSVGLVDNPLCPLDAADIVFIDPVDTGYSRTLPGTSPAPFHSIDGDSDSITQLILNWLKRNDRMASPKYVYGESYGSMRAVALARDLARSPDKVDIDGVILGGEAIPFGQRGRLPHPEHTASHLPMMASVAWYHGRIDNKHQSWEQAVQKAREYARGEYVGALMQGYRLDAATRERVVRRLPALIGIPERYFREHHTIVVEDFNKDLLHDQGLVLDRNNGMETLPAAKFKTEDDTDFTAMLAGITKNFEAYARTELGVSGLGDYLAITPSAMAVYYGWNFYTSGDRSLDATLSKAMKANPRLRVLVVQGRYDTLTELGETLVEGFFARASGDEQEPLLLARLCCHMRLAFSWSAELIRVL